MSTKPTKSTPDKNALVAATEARVVALSFANVPSLGTNPGADEAKKWQASIAECVGIGEDFALKTREYTQQSLVMILMDAQLQTLDYYKSELNRLKISLPQKQDTITYALALHLRLDVGLASKDLARNNSKKLNRYASAAHHLRELARTAFGSRETKFEIDYDAGGVLKMLELVVAAKGINELAKGSGDAATKIKPIAISSEGLIARQEERLENKLDKGSELKIAITDTSGKLELLKELHIPAAAMALIYPQLKLADKRIQCLNEMFAVGEAVAEEKTDILAYAEVDDPNDAHAPRRLSSRQYVFNPDGTLTLSPILREASVIVHVTPHVDLLGMKVLGHVKLHTAGRRQAAANIAGYRADAFDYSLGSTEGTEGVARITLTTPLAIKEGDRTKDVGMLIELVRSKPGNLPLIITPAFKTTVELGPLPDLLDKMEDVASTGKRLIANNMNVKIVVEQGRLSLWGATKQEKISVGESPTGVKMSVRVDDFIAVTAALKSIDTDGPPRLAFGDGMMVISADTEFASYTLYIPRALSDGTRDNSNMCKLVPVAWPRPAKDDAAEVEADAAK